MTQIIAPSVARQTLLFLGAVAMGAGSWAHALAINDEPRISPGEQQTPVAAKPNDVPQSPAPGRMFVVGRVLDPQGEPVPGATIMVHARSLELGHAPYESRRTQLPIGEARADSSGRFRLDAPRTSSWHHEAFGAIALAPGHGAGWVELDPDDDQPTAEITLPPEHVAHGRLVDLQGRPVPGVTLSVASIRRVLPTAPARARSRFDGIAYSFTDVNAFPAWPGPVTTDHEGRYTLHGVGRDLHAVLTVHHPRFALQRIEIDTDGASESNPQTAALAPAQIITGRVTYADTGKPAPHAPLDVRASQGRVALPAAFETDAEGRFRVTPPPADHSFRVMAFPPEGQPYLTASKGLIWPKAALEQSLNFVLTRGVLIHGKVTEEGSGKPVPGAIVEFERGRQDGVNRSLILETASDGSFQLGVESSPGYLFVQGPGNDYVSQAIGYRMVEQGLPGGRRIYSHARALLNLKPGIDSQEVNLVLHPGATVTGQVVGPDGQPVRDAWIFSRIILDPRPRGRGSWNGRHHGKVRNGRFEVHGLEAGTEVPVYFLDPKHKLGGVADLSVKSAAGGPVTVRLGPCGAARARLVDPDGKPYAGRLPRGFLIFSMVVTPGPPFTSPKDPAGLLAADEDDLTSVDPVNHENEPVSDSDGRITFPALIPGATYRFIDFTAAIRGENGPELRKEFTVKPGETVDLGDIRIEKPQP